MELRHFEAFVAVAEELHFSKAAERLHIAQPPLSQRIRQMEKQLGVDLFVRSTRSVVLTPAGEALLGPARKVTRGFAGGTGRGEGRGARRIRPGHDRFRRRIEPHRVAYTRRRRPRADIRGCNSICVV